MHTADLQVLPKRSLAVDYNGDDRALPVTWSPTPSTGPQWLPHRCFTPFRPNGCSHDPSLMHSTSLRYRATQLRQLNCVK